MNIRHSIYLPLVVFAMLMMGSAGLESARADDVYEPNDTLETARRSDALDTPPITAIQADEDWFRLPLGYSVGGETLFLLRCQFLHSEGDINIEVYDYLGTNIRGSYGITDTERLYLRLPEGILGVNFRYARIFGANAGNQYVLWWDQKAPGIDLTPFPLGTPTYVSRSSVNPGDSIQCNLAFENAGDIDSPAFNIRILASSDTAVGNDYELKKSRFDTLDYVKGFTEAGLNSTFDFPYGIPSGSYYILWQLDSDGEVSEVRENNNVAIHPQKLTVYNPPNTPTLTSPGNGATGQSLTPTLRASAYSDPDGDAHANSQWQVDCDNGFSYPDWDSGASHAAGVSAQVSSGVLEYDTLYYWRVRYKDSRGAWSLWSDVRLFRTIGESDPPPSKAINPTPASGASDQDRNVDLSWANGGGATSYDVYFNGQFQDNRPGTTFEPGPLDFGTTYQWRIDSVNGGGTTSGDVWSFTTGSAPPAPPSKATSPSPTNGAGDQDRNVDLSWENGGGATSYDVYFNGQFQDNRPGTTFDPGPLDYGTTYQWRIDAVNGGGTTTGDPWSFTTEQEDSGEVFPGRTGMLRILSGGPTRFLDIKPNGLLVWSNATPGSSGHIQISSSIVPRWTDIHPFTAAERFMNTQLPGGIDSAPAGMVLIFGETNAGTDPDFGAYSLTVTSFYMDKFEVTKALWDEVYNWAVANGYGFDNAGSGKATNHPVHTVNWYDAVKWCNARSQKEGRPAVYTVNGAVYKAGQSNDVVQMSAAGYRLPTDMEWEYAARGGVASRRFPWGDSDEIQHARANYYSWTDYSYDTSLTRGWHPTYDIGDSPYTSPVGSFAANLYGLHDMAGNVCEWCFDFYPAVVQLPRLIRGGSYRDMANNVRVRVRMSLSPDSPYHDNGLRTVLSLGQ